METRLRPHSASVQARIEAHSLDLAREPVVQAAGREGARAMLEAIPDVDEASRERFGRVAEEITRNALIGLADGYFGEDLPRLIMRPTRSSGGRAFPGNRGLHDNPDTFYRLVPLDGQSDFVLEGEASAHPATIFEMSALTSQWHTLGHLTKTDLGIAPGSRFRVHFGPAGSAGASSARNVEVDHEVALDADAEMLLVRETLADWSLERPSRLAIENRVERGGPRAQDDAARIEWAARRVAKWWHEAIRLTAAPLAQPINFFPTPVISGEHGKLVTMAYSIGHFRVHPDEALVLRIDPGSAEYVGVPITNLWGTTNQNWARGASLNSRQVEMNSDGTFTCVLSLGDPGIANWLDPDGLERGFLFIRWAGLDPQRVPDRLPAIETECVSLDRLDALLEPELHRVDANERRRRLDQRERDHAQRFEELDRE